jgi:DNA repair ATPase RecN
MRMLAHETIHWNQYKKVGLNKIDKIKSGHQKGTEIANRTGNQMDWMREYLKDPHELMAYASDLASEIKDLDNPEQVLRNPEAHKQDLPSYARYRQVFEPNSREIRQLLKYTADYYSN